MKTLYDELNVSPKATKDAITSAYLALLPCASAEEAEALTEAFTTLRDPAKRATHDLANALEDHYYALSLLETPDLLNALPLEGLLSIARKYPDFALAWLRDPENYSQNCDLQTWIREGVRYEEHCLPENMRILLAIPRFKAAFQMEDVLRLFRDLPPQVFNSQEADEVLRLILKEPGLFDQMVQTIAEGSGDKAEESEGSFPGHEETDSVSILYLVYHNRPISQQAIVLKVLMSILRDHSGAQERYKAYTAACSMNKLGVVAECFPDSEVVIKRCLDDFLQAVMWGHKAHCEDAWRFIQTSKKQNQDVPLPQAIGRFAEEISVEMEGSGFNLFSYAEIRDAIDNDPDAVMRILRHVAFLQHLIEDPKSSHYTSESINALKTHHAQCLALWLQVKDHLPVGGHPLLDRLRCFLEDSETACRLLEDGAFRESLSATELGLLVFARPVLAEAIVNYPDCMDKFLGAYNDSFMETLIPYLIHRDPELMTAYSFRGHTDESLQRMVTLYIDQRLYRQGLDYLMGSLEDVKYDLARVELVSPTRMRYCTVRDDVCYARTTHKLQQAPWVSEIVDQFAAQAYQGETLARFYCRFAWQQYMDFRVPVQDPYTEGLVLGLEAIAPFISYLNQPVYDETTGSTEPAFFYLDKDPHLKALLAQAAPLIMAVLVRPKKLTPALTKFACEFVVMFGCPELNCDEKRKFCFDNIKQVEAALLQRLHQTRDLQVLREVLDPQTFLGSVMQLYMKRFQKKVPIAALLFHDLCQTNDLQALREACDPETSIGRIVQAHSKKHSVIEQVLIHYLRQAEEPHVTRLLEEICRHETALGKFISGERAKQFEALLHDQAFSLWSRLYSGRLNAMSQAQNLNDMSDREKALQEFEAKFWGDGPCPQVRRHYYIGIDFYGRRRRMCKSNYYDVEQWKSKSSQYIRLLNDKALQFMPEIAARGKLWRSVVRYERSLMLDVWVAFNGQQLEANLRGNRQREMVTYFAKTYFRPYPAKVTSSLTLSWLSAYRLAEAWIMDPKSLVALLKRQADYLLEYCFSPKNPGFMDRNYRRITPPAEFPCWLLAVHPDVDYTPFRRDFKRFKKAELVQHLARVIINRGDPELYHNLLNSKFVEDFNIRKSLTKAVEQADPYGLSPLSNTPQPTATEVHSTAKQAAPPKTKSRTSSASSDEGPSSRDRGTVAALQRFGAIVGTPAVNPPANPTGCTTTTTTYLKGSSLNLAFKDP